MYDNISGFYFKLKKYDSALYYKKEIVRIMDSIHKSEIKEHVGFENKKVELLEKDYHNQIKAAGQEHFLSHLKKRNFQLFCTVIVLIVFMLLFLLYFKQYRLKLKKERLQGDLDFLKAQLNPNFLFNSLNNIYVLLDQDKNKALTLLVQFCELLRHQLYDCHVSSILLSEELRFLENYVDFEKLRYEGKITVEHNLRETEAGDLYIAPIVLQPFIENTFKQSPKSRQFPGHISIRSAVIENNFFMEVKNLVGAKEKPELPGGVELENAKKRLNLLYPGKHELKISATDTSLEVQLKITLSEN
jgi:LytS/YehU family sensor histidine kinase